MPNKLEFSILPDHNSVRIDKWLAENVPDITRTTAQRLCDENLVLVCGKVVNKNYKLRTGDVLDVTIPDPHELNVVPQDIPLEVVYEDRDLLVVNKSKGMVVHPAAGNYDGTMVNALLYRCKGQLSGINGVIRPGIVHRIDKNTSGLLIVAKNDKSHTALAAQINAHTFTRVYEAMVYGNVKQDKGTVDAPIGRHPTFRKKMCVIEKNSRSAITHYEVIARYNGFTHIRCRLETGRTHQIRVHMAYIGHPVAGDDVYGPKKVIKSLEGQCLHAKVIGFIHPTTGEYMEFESELPLYFKSFLNTLKQ
ncbi:ribosomal large subunit pseudouridine synthase D [Hydrogenoanaerobacterium saccharovorans]|uniref:Pseudouridine synthase n=1 Tax=Hydrogenoanaerobacterium saccharovorans TaxID=474960 RepID=A0A1H7ZM55_9FIRM|nr:RluA family pseudouridine synthase [Hydrogenoanaerobacterium saccharovorans]RPF48557.1 ribosomal large subunit pseudouridine synthase D [Hydrogenoanaerobacterium saccharovorans]SEM58527.1 ribosomal large subunit pseudouridine synthase D [Hydrogenoanaerobacterium saccharovorans]